MLIFTSNDIIMGIILSVGIVIFSGFLLGELAERIKLPKISGYIIAGLLLNPGISGIVSEEFVSNTDSLLTMALSVITFSIGGALKTSKLKSTGKQILLLTVSESLFAFLAVFIVLFVSLNYFIPLFSSLYVNIAVSLVLASLAAPTDPSATLDVIHEYKAKGEVSSSMLQIAAFDDITGIIIYTLVTASATIFLGKSDVVFCVLIFNMLKKIGGAILLGIITGILFNFVTNIFNKQSEGSLIVLTFGLILLNFGICDFFNFDSLLSTMSLGAVVVNFNPHSEKIFKLIERYTDELIFVIFFTLSGLNLQLTSLNGSFMLIVIYIIARIIGKFTGIYTGSVAFNANPRIKKFSAGGLIPQGGIVIGLALLLSKNPAFNDTSSTIIGIIIGAALIHEIIGPLFSKYYLKKAGEIS